LERHLRTPPGVGLDFHFKVRLGRTKTVFFTLFQRLFLSGDLFDELDDERNSTTSRA